jgi:hypothetical protein
MDRQKFGLLRNMPMLIVLFVTCPAIAEDQSKRHDGFFLQMSAGAAFAKNSVIDDAGAENTVQGGGSSWSLSIGHALSENLILHGDLFGAALVEPELYTNGQIRKILPGKYTLGALGAGITYYFMPLNLYLTGALGVSVLSANVGIWRVESETGFAANFMVGKEWWVSDHWGIGVAGQFIFSEIPSQFEENNHTFVAAVLLSATYN